MEHNDRSCNNKSVVSGDNQSGESRSRGSWITFPFLIGCTALLIVAGVGWSANLIVYLIREFNVKSIDAAQISNVVNGSVSLLPILAAIIADSFLGSFSVIVISSSISIVGIILLTLTSTVDSLRPHQGAIGTNDGQSASSFQMGVLYAALALSSVGLGGFRYTMATLGADQFDEPQAQGIFFNWYFFGVYSASVVGLTAIVFIQDNVSWGLGFGHCAAANLVGLLIFVLGKRFYCRESKRQGSPFVALARVVVASFRKRRLTLSSTIEDYYYERDGKSTTTLTNSFRFLNKAALKTEQDTKSDGSIARPWKLCTVQQVEDLKTVIKMLPLWSTSILLGTPIAIQASLTILQALTMDPHLGPHFKVPPSSILVLVLISTSLALTLIDRFLCPTWRNLTGRLPTPLQRIGLGHVLNILGMAASASVESQRLKKAHRNYVSLVPMSVVWLFPQLVLVGVGEAFHFPGQVALYYREFPVTLRNMSTGVVGLLVGVAFYLSTGVIDLIRRVTGWLPDDINRGRVDNVYWVLVVLGVINFVYYLVCAKLYKYQNVDRDEEDS